MREILFRGKKANGEWVYGKIIDNIYGAKYPIIVYFPDYNDGNQIDFEWEFVSPETVGQFTGLADKNGKKIFEGDILKRQWGDYPQQCVHYTVEFGFGEFELVETETKAKRFISYHNECEVIGNIYDNPELLEGGGGNE